MKKKKASDKFITLFICLIIFAGFLVLMYPTFSNLYFEYREKQLIRKYETKTEQLSEDDTEKYFALAREYNKSNLLDDVPDAFAVMEYTAPNEIYEGLFNIDGNGLMGYIEIPCINVNLPIFHGVDDDSLQNGVGHLEGSALPTGDVGNHVVIAGHRGLPSAKIFTDLDLVKKDDEFYLHILGRTMAYKIDSIRVVDPTDTKALSSDPGKDLVTLVTCTPYGINTQRLLIRGERVPYDEQVYVQQKEENRITVTNHYVLYPIIAFGFVVLTVIVILLTRKKKGGKKKNANKKKKNS